MYKSFTHIDRENMSVKPLPLRVEGAAGFQAYATLLQWIQLLSDGVSVDN